MFTNYNSRGIADAIKKQLKHGRYPSNKLFGDGNTGQKIADKLANIELNSGKRLMY